jgi:hypothetical protein
LTVVGSIISLNVTLTVVFTETPVALLAGVTPLTVGAVLSELVLVEKEAENVVTSALPAKSLTRGSLAPPSTLTVKLVLDANSAVGASVATLLAAS